MTKIRVALIDDHQMIADMLGAALRATHADRFEFVGAAHRLSEVGDLIERGPADVALVDFSLPDGHGTVAIRQLKRSWARVHVVLFTGHDAAEVLEEAAAAGADGVLTKRRGMAELLEVVERASRGEVLFEPDMIRSLALRTRYGPATPSAADQLTVRERATLEALLTEGDPERAAAQLHISHATLRAHVANAMAKLDAGSRLEAISRALRAGVIRPPENIGFTTL